MKQYRIMIFMALLASVLSCRQSKYIASVTDLQLVNTVPPSAYSGSIIKILGRNFSTDFGGNRVTVGGKEAKVLEYNAWDLTVVLPENVPGKYEVTVTTPKGTVGGLMFEYTEKPEVEYIVSIYAGGTRGTVDGTGTAAQFDFPEGIIMKDDGSLFILQRGSTFAVRRIDRFSNVTTFATSTLFSHPWQGAFDAAGNLFFGNKSGKAVIKVTPAGESSVYAIGGATLDNPMGMKFDSDGNMYLANRNMNQVLKVKDGVQVKSFDNLPMASCVCIDSKGRLIVGSETAGYITMVDADGKYVNIAGTGKTSGTGNLDGTPGDPSSAVIGTVGGIFAGEDGAVYFTDRTSLSVRKLVPAEDGDYTKGKVVTIASGFYPSDLVVSKDCRRIYVTSATSHTVRLIEAI